MTGNRCLLRVLVSQSVTCCKTRSVVNRITRIMCGYNKLNEELAGSYLLGVRVQTDPPDVLFLAD
jgi:hypothetical protein